MKNLENLDISEIEAFMLVAKHGGLRVAARESKKSQSNLSKKLIRLEQRVGKLFERSGSKMALTQEGHRLLPFANSVMSSVGDFLRKNNRRERCFNLGVACSACLGLADRFMDRARQGGFHVEPHEGVSTELVQQIASGELHAMLGRYQLDQLPTGIEGRVVAIDHLGLICPTGHALDKEQLSVQEVGSVPVVGLEVHLSPGLEAELADCWLKSNFAWAPTRRAKGPAALLAMVLAGQGVTVLPDRAFSTFQGLSFRPFIEPYAVSRVVLLWRKDGCPVDSDQLLDWTLA